VLGEVAMVVAWVSPDWAADLHYCVGPLWFGVSKVLTGGVPWFESAVLVKSTSAVLVKLAFESLVEYGFVMASVFGVKGLRNRTLSFSVAESPPVAGGLMRDSLSGWRLRAFCKVESTPSQAASRRMLLVGLGARDLRGRKCSITVWAHYEDPRPGPVESSSSSPACLFPIRFRSPGKASSPSPSGRSTSSPSEAGQPSDASSSLEGRLLHGAWPEARARISLRCPEKNETEVQGLREQSKSGSFDTPSL
jgi:hypothetical protein